MREVGAQLRQVRLERGEDLDDVAKSLRIRSSYLFAIEDGDLSALPGRTYALGFLRSYADYLGFDGDDLVGRIKASVGQLTDRTRLRVRAPMPENRLPRTPMVVISLVAVVGIYLGWSYVNRTSRTVMDSVAEVPGNLREPAGDELARDLAAGAPPAEAQGVRVAVAPDRASGATETGPPAEVAAAGSIAAGPASPASEVRASSAPGAPTMDPSAPAATTRADSVEPAPVAAGELAALPADAAAPTAVAAARDVDPSAPGRLPRGERDALSVQPAAGGEQGGAQPATAADDAADRDPARQAVALLLEAAARDAQGSPAVYETVNADARVILRARAQSWIQVSSPAGDYRFTRTLEPGEAVLVPNRADLELWTGNAGGLEVMVDGIAIGPLAGAGAVRRNISLDPARLMAGSKRPR